MKCPKCGGDTTVVETRAVKDFVATRRLRDCTVCTNRFATYEIDDGIWPTVRKWAMKSHAKAVKADRARMERNIKVLAAYERGEKIMNIASEFGISENLIPYIVTKMGGKLRRPIKGSKQNERVLRQPPEPVPVAKVPKAKHLQQEPPLQRDVRTQWRESAYSYLGREDPKLDLRPVSES